MVSEDILTQRAFISTPIGMVEIIAELGQITGLYFREQGPQEIVPEALTEACRQIKSYFSGELLTFSLPLKLNGTAFQQSVWKLLLNVQYGTTTTYGELADKLNIRNGARAVGLANGANPVSIIVPCHRVIGRNGKLTGYAGGLWRKEWLLKLESAELNKGLFLK